MNSFESELGALIDKYKEMPGTSVDDIIADLQAAIDDLEDEE